jgi:hypothetical protein
MGHYVQNASDKSPRLASDEVLLQRESLRSFLLEGSEVVVHKPPDPSGLGFVKAYLCLTTSLLSVRLHT